MSRNPCDFSPDTRRSLWWQLSFLSLLGSDVVSLYKSSCASFSPLYFGYYDASETSVRTHQTTRCQNEPSSACPLPPPLSLSLSLSFPTHQHWRGWPLVCQQRTRNITPLSCGNTSEPGCSVWRQYSGGHREEAVQDFLYNLTINKNIKYSSSLLNIRRPYVNWRRCRKFSCQFGTVKR
jgi:hypothetical protein